MKKKEEHNMELCEVETKFTFLIKSVILDGISYPLIYEVSIFNDGSGYLKEILRTPKSDENLHDLTFNWKNKNNRNELNDTHPEVAVQINKYMYKTYGVSLYNVEKQVISSKKINRFDIDWN